MPYASHGKNTMLDNIGITHASLHTAAPSDAGSNEVTGGAPAYARKAISFGAASAGAIDSSTAPVFDVPSGTTVTHVGFFDALTVGNFKAYAAVTNEVFGSQGTYTLSDADLDLNT